MYRSLLLAALALSPTLPALAQEPTSKPVLGERTTTNLREALSAAFEREKVGYIIGPGVDGMVSANVPSLPLSSYIELLLLSADKPVKAQFKVVKRGPSDADVYGVWVVKVDSTPAGPQPKAEPAQVTVNNYPPKSPLISNFTIPAGADPLVAVLELQISLLEQEITSSQYGPGHPEMKALQNQLLTVKRQLALRRAQATKKTTAKK